MSSFKLENVQAVETVNEVTYSVISSTDVVDLSTSDNTVIDPATNLTYVVNNLTGVSVTLTLGNSINIGQQKTVIVTGGGTYANLIISFTDNHGNDNSTTTLFGTPGDIVQLVSTQKGWGIPFFDIK